MVDEMKGETVDMIVTACEKFPGNYEVMQKQLRKIKRHRDHPMQYLSCLLISRLKLLIRPQPNQWKKWWIRNVDRLGM